MSCSVLSIVVVVVVFVFVFDRVHPFFLCALEKLRFESCFHIGLFLFLLFMKA